LAIRDPEVVGTFDDPIPLPRGRQLVTLEDAGTKYFKLT